MSKTTKYPVSLVGLMLPASLAVVPVAYAGMKSLDDSAMSQISGQSGITIEAGISARADRLSYFDDGQAIHLEDFRIGGINEGDASFHKTKFDIAGDGALNLEFLAENRRIEIGDISLAGSDQGMGGIFFDQGRMTSNVSMRSGGALGPSGYTYDFSMSLQGGRLGYRTNGNEVFFNNMTANVTSNNNTLDVNGDTLQLRSPEIDGFLVVGGMLYSDGPVLDYDDVSSLASYGSFYTDFTLSSETDIKAGGFSGEGLTVDNRTTIQDLNFTYSDNGGYGFSLNDVTGFLNINDLKIDVDNDPLGRQALALRLGSVEGELDIGNLGLGVASSRRVGAFNLSFLFDDREFNGRTYTNAVYLQGGGHVDAGPQGLRAAAEWSLSNADLAWTEDGNKVIFSGIQSWGQGDFTVNVTRDEQRNGTQFYDGIRLGFENVSAGYRINGLRIGDEDAALQGGTELLLALGFYPSYEFDLDGHMTIGAGGAEGSGLTINSDIQIRNGKAAIVANPYDEGQGEVTQTGLWFTELSYDSHVRDMTVDATNEGLAIITGESWGTMDIGNIRVGGKNGGASFGRLVIQSYEKGSSIRIERGGSGTVCVGGSGGTAAACAASGGAWEDRGEQGVTVRLKQIFAKALNDTRKNAITWETNREVDASGNPINDTGTKLVLNDIYTSDGDDSSSNEFGIRTELGIDVYQTKVVKKEDGPDSQGVTGSRGDERIMDAQAPSGYRYVSNPTAAEKENRPLGFAVQARSQFKELSINNIDLVHSTGGAQTALYGAKLQNVDIKANLTATPIQ